MKSSRTRGSWTCSATSLTNRGTSRPSIRA
jgi:hypothetical protein